MFRCVVHGVGPAVLCCSHVDVAVSGGVGIGVEYVFDDFGQVYLICPMCLGIVRDWVGSVGEGNVEEYPLDVVGECREHVREWCEVANGVDLGQLYREAEKRTGRRAER